MRPLGIAKLERAKTSGFPDSVENGSEKV